MNSICCFTFQELEAEIRMFEQQSDQCEDTNEYISMDESALLELQNLTQQVNCQSDGSGINCVFTN